MKNENAVWKIKKEDLRNILVICCAVLALTLPFVNKAVHIDGVYVVAAAKNILKDPFDPYGFDFDFAAAKIPFHSYYSNSPLLSYVLAAVFYLVGENTIIAHAVFIIFPLIAAISFYYIAKRYTSFPFIAALLLISSPVFLVMSHNFMQDIPMASLFLLCLALFMHGVDVKSRAWLIVGSFVGGLAILMKYTAFLIIPVLLVYLFQKKELKRAGYLLIMVGVAMSWMVLSFLLYHSVHTLQAFSNYDGESFGSLEEFVLKLAVRGVSELSLMGGVLMFPLCLVIPFLMKRKYVWMFLASLFLSICMAWVLHSMSGGFISGQYAFGELCLLAVFFSSAMFFIMVIVDYMADLFFKGRNISAFVHGDGVFIFIWFFAMVCSIVVLVGGAARYNTLILAPSVLLFVRMVGFFQKRYAFSVLNVCLFLTLILGIMVSVADYRYAEVYRMGAEKFSSLETGTNTVWFIGHHGFAYYMPLKNGEFYSEHSELKKDDYIVKASIPSPRKISEMHIGRIILVSKEYVLDGFPIRTENPFSHAGFYTFGSGFLPYSFSNAPLEEFSVYKVVEDSK